MRAPQMDRYAVKSESEESWNDRRQFSAIANVKSQENCEPTPKADVSQRPHVDVYNEGPIYRNDPLAAFPLDFYSRHHQALTNGFLSAYSNVANPNFPTQQYVHQCPPHHSGEAFDASKQPPSVYDYAAKMKSAEAHGGCEMPLQNRQPPVKMNLPLRNEDADCKPKGDDPDKGRKLLEDPKYGYASQSVGYPGGEYYENVESNESMHCNAFAQKGENPSGESNGPAPVDAKTPKETRFACWKCKCAFASRYSLKEHFKVCTSNLNPENPLENGLVREKPEPKGKYSCETCPYICQSPATLKIHERIHSGEKPFACSFCEYKSGQKNNVAKHVLVHMKKKPYKCQYCDYRCAQKNNLVVHERTHTGFKPFACTFCEYKTVQKPNLVKHMYLHTNEKPFACDVCDYRCVQKTNLTKHKQKHTMEKPYECSDCDYRCSQKVNLNKHLSVHRKYDNSESFKCDSCNYVCYVRSDLDKHVKLRHRLLKQESDDCVISSFEPGNLNHNARCEQPVPVVYNPSDSIKIEASNINF